MTKYAIVINETVVAFVEATEEEVRKSLTIRKVDEEVKENDKVDKQGKRKPVEETLMLSDKLNYLRLTDWTQIPDNLPKKESEAWATWRQNIRQGVWTLPPGDLVNYGLN